MLTPPYLSPRRHPAFAERDLWNMSSRLDHSGFAPANFTTLPHFSVHEDSVRGPHQGQQSTRTAPTGRTHDCKRPCAARQMISCQAGAIHT